LRQCSHKRLQLALNLTDNTRFIREQALLDKKRDMREAKRKRIQAKKVEAYAPPPEDNPGAILALMAEMAAQADTALGRQPVSIPMPLVFVTNLGSVIELTPVSAALDEDEFMLLAIAATL